jgi:hypothetical protein
MPWLPLYADETDIPELASWLNADDDVAFIAADRPRCWKAVSSVDAITGGRYCLWHVPSGPLPLLGDGPVQDNHVPDPWAGWTEMRTGADPRTPYFGPGHPGVIWLNPRPAGYSRPGAVGLSSFEWIGNHYRLIGSPAPEATEKWWQRLRRSVKKVAIRVPREGPCNGPHPEIWAFLSAYQRFLQGVPWDPNP